MADLKKDFFETVVTSRVLVMVNSDVDGLCATKILQYLFKCDHVLYTLIPVQGKKDLFNAFKTNIEGVKYCVLINCGATIDLCDFLDPPEDVVFFVMDNHRPVDVTNIYNDGQVRLLMRRDTDEQIPEYDEIFRDDSDSEDDSEDEYGEKRKRFDEESLLKKRERREWEEQRHGILFSYTRDSYFGTSSALQLYELAWRMSRDSNDLLWWAVIGHTELFVHCKIEDDRHLTDTGNLQNHVARLNTRGEGEVVAVDCLKLQAESELNLALYRHWSIAMSLRHTPYTAAKFKTFTLKGEHRLSEFLADMGLPLQQCSQNFQNMDLALKQDIVPSITGKAEKYGLGEITYSSFNCSFGFRHRYCAADLVMCLRAVSEHREKGEGGTSFLQALDTLARTHTDKLEAGIKVAKSQLELIVKQVQNILDTKQVVSAGPFLYSIIQDGTPNWEYFCRPSTVTCLAQFLLQAHVSCSHSRKVTSMPLVLVTPLDPEQGLSVVVGIPPTDDKSRKNFLGKAFEQAVEKTSSRYLLDYWDSNIIQIKTEDRTKFLDGLIAIMSQ